MSDDSKRVFDSADDLTRRQWILRLGEFIALAGVSGLIPEADASWAQEPEKAKALELPPGLYGPSQDHLVHALSSAGKNWTPPVGSETEYALPSSVPYKPQFFSPEEFRIATRLVEVLLGEVGPAASSQAAQWFDLWLSSASAIRDAAQKLDPMHRALASAFFGESTVRELETARPEGWARMGIGGLHDFSNRVYGRDFLKLTDAEQVELLSILAKAEGASSLTCFFKLARNEAIRGYYSSAEGLKELDYRGNAYYGECPGGCDSVDPRSKE